MTWGKKKNNDNDNLPIAQPVPNAPSLEDNPFATTSRAPNKQEMVRGGRRRRRRKSRRRRRKSRRRRRKSRRRRRTRRRRRRR